MTILGYSLPSSLLSSTGTWRKEAVDRFCPLPAGPAPGRTVPYSPPIVAPESFPSTAALPRRAQW